MQCSTFLILFSLMCLLIQICLAEEVKYIVSPYESDAQIAHLLASGEADFALTEDSDLLVFGCEKVIDQQSKNHDLCIPTGDKRGSHSMTSMVTSIFLWA